MSAFKTAVGKTWKNVRLRSPSITTSQKEILFVLIFQKGLFYINYMIYTNERISTTQQMDGDQVKRDKFKIQNPLLLPLKEKKRKRI